MKSIWGKLLALQIFGLLLVLSAGTVILGPGLQRDSEVQFNTAGQGLTQTLSSAVAHLKVGPHGRADGKRVQALVAEAQTQPGVAWVCVTGRDGRPLAQAGRAPQSLSHSPRTVTASVFPPALPPARQTITVFHWPVKGGAAGTAYVALADDFRAAARRQAQGRIAAVAGAALLVVGLLSALLLRGHRRSVHRLAEAVQGLEAGGASALPPTGGGGELGTLEAAVRALLARIDRREHDVRQKEAKFRSPYEDAVIGFWQSTPEGRFLRLNPAMARLYGYDTPDAMMREVTDGGRQMSVDPARRAQYARLMQERGAALDFESQMRRRDGKIIWVRETARVVRDAGGALCYFEGTAEDVSARKRAEAERDNLANHLRLLLESSGEGIFGVNPQGQCTFVNNAASHLLGYPPEELLGRNMHDTVHHSHADRSPYPMDRSYLFQCLQTGQGRRVDDEVLWRRDGTPFPAEYTASPLIEDGRIAGAVVTFVDISARKALETDQKRLLAEALDRAERDPLTGLLNHRAFQKRLEEEADRAQRAGTLLAIALLDVDNFKFFNDVYGHKVGDEVLLKVADALRGCSRSYDTLARFGGDEFALLMPCTGDEKPADLASDLSHRLAGVAYRPQGYDQSIPLGLSVGVAIYPQEGATRLETLETADERLRRAKTGGDEDGYAERVRASLTQSREGFSMLDALVTAVDNKDRYTRRHSEDVMRYSAEIAQALGLDEKTIRVVETAALIHDVGKIGVPDHILRKPGKLSDEDFAAIQQHPMMGAVIAEAVPGFEETLDAVRHHHERWDGKGYPFGLHGTECPLIARLMAVADAFSAMTTDRPYRKGMPHEKALGILEEGAGTQWDPECVAAFLRARRGAASVPA